MLERLRKMAEILVNKAKECPGIEEVAIVGSVASHDKYAVDCDFAIIISDFLYIDKIAKAVRQMSSIFHGWDVFVFDFHRNYRGRICSRRDCPASSIDCFVPGCGEIPHLRVINGFKFDEKKLLSRKVEVLWTREKVIILKWQKDVLKDLGLKNPTKYEVFKDQILICKDCKQEFIWKGKEQKYFETMGWPLPSRCPDCRPARCPSCNSALFMTRGEAKERKVTHCEECRLLAGLDDEENET